MAKLRTLTRRAFLIGSAAVTGGVAFGAWYSSKPYDNPLAEGLAEGEATFNPWVKITSDRVTFIAPHADLGQGVQHMQVALIAEELDIDPAQVHVEFGNPSPAYYNRAFADEGVPFMSFDDSFAANTARGVASRAIKMLGMMGTGGSTAVPDSFDKLREAGAVARETLKAAAAVKAGVPPGDLKTDNGAVVLPNGTAIPYTDLAADAAGIEPVRDIALRDPANWKLLGKPMQRGDILSKSTGTQDYGIDLMLDGMLNATVRISPRIGVGVKSADTSFAETMPGVDAVLPVTGGFAVLADNTWNAIQAANAIEVEWEDSPYPPEMDAHWDTLSNSFTEDRLDSVWREEGDVATALSAASDIVEVEYRAPYLAHAPLEPLSAIVMVAEDGQSAEVWTGHQFPIFLQQKVAQVVGCDRSAVTFHNQFSGGSFGHRLEFDWVVQTAEIANQRRGTPIKMTYSREEDFAHDYPRQIAMARGKGAVAGGEVSAYDLSIAAPSVMASQGARIGAPLAGPDMQIVSGAWSMPFDIANLRVAGYRAPELAPISSWRSVGASHAGFFAEGFMDELIRAAGADPLEERLRLVNHPVHRAVLDAVGEMSNWGSDLGPNRGRGLALVESFGVPVAEVVEVTATDRGITIDKVYVAADVGRVLDPVNIENLIQGGVIYGLSHAMNCEITYSGGEAQQMNFWDHEGMRLYQCPQIDVKVLENADRIRGIGEPPTPPAAPALANAIFDATGQRLREMPFNKFIDFA